MAASKPTSCLSKVKYFLTCT